MTVQELDQARSVLMYTILSPMVLLQIVFVYVFVRFLYKMTFAKPFWVYFFPSMSGYFSLSVVYALIAGGIGVQDFCVCSLQEWGMTILGWAVIVFAFFMNKNEAVRLVPERYQSVRAVRILWLNVVVIAPSFLVRSACFVYLLLHGYGWVTLTDSTAQLLIQVQDISERICGCYVTGMGWAYFVSYWHLQKPLK